jgi:exodeoxyribonuclease VII large subunit
MTTGRPGNGILSVGELTRRIKETLSSDFPGVWVRGEVTGYKRQPQTGNVYFCLKDRFAQLDCMMWAKEAARLPFEPRDGLQVEAFGGISVYEPRGKYQLYVSDMRPAGEGARLLALEALKKKLNAEGLFDPSRKRPLPRYPRRIGLVTSPSGAAMRDLVTVLRSRWPAIGLVLAPVRVQGEGAAQEIAWAIRRFNRYGRVDLLIVGRGGGSLEDLWAFNEELVVRAIAASTIPVISAVGHEVDVTLADFAADVRAATPSNAAELAVRDRRAIGSQAKGLELRLRRAMEHGLAVRRQRYDHLIEKHGFRRRWDAFRLWRRRVEDCALRARTQMTRRLRVARRRLEGAASAYGLREFPRRLGEWRVEIRVDRQRLERAVAERLATRRRSIATCEARLGALSPRRVLERGYCLVRRPDGTLLRAATSLAAGDPIRVEFARGDADARVERVRAGEEHGG